VLVKFFGHLENPNQQSVRLHWRYNGDKESYKLLVTSVEAFKNQIKYDFSCCTNVPYKVKSSLCLTKHHAFKTYPVLN